MNPVNTKCSYTDPNDGIRTPQETHIQHQEVLRDNAQNNMINGTEKAVVSAIGGSIGAYNGRPDAATLGAVGTVWGTSEMIRNASAYSTHSKRMNALIGQEQTFLNNIKKR